MPSVELFFVENEEKQEPIEIEVSKKFKDKDGNVIKWKIAPVSSEDDKFLQRACTTVERNRRTGQMTEHLDQQEYMVSLAARGVVEPDLTDKKLWENRKAKSAPECLRKMLSVGEMINLASAVMEVSGMTDDLLSPMQQDINTAKN